MTPLAGRIARSCRSFAPKVLLANSHCGTADNMTSTSALRLQARFDLADRSLAPKVNTALSGLINIKGNIRGSNTHQHEPKTGNAGFTKQRCIPGNLSLARGYRSDNITSKVSDELYAFAGSGHACHTIYGQSARTRTEYPQICGNSGVKPLRTHHLWR